MGNVESGAHTERFAVDQFHAALAQGVEGGAVAPEIAEFAVYRLQRPGAVRPQKAHPARQRAGGGVAVAEVLGVVEGGGDGQFAPRVCVAVAPSLRRGDAQGGKAIGKFGAELRLYGQPRVRGRAVRVNAPQARGYGVAVRVAVEIFARGDEKTALAVGQHAAAGAGEDLRAVFADDTRPFPLPDDDHAGFGQVPSAAVQFVAQRLAARVQQAVARKIPFLHTLGQRGKHRCGDEQRPLRRAFRRRDAGGGGIFAPRGQRFSRVGHQQRVLPGVHRERLRPRRGAQKQRAKQQRQKPAHAKPPFSPWTKFPPPRLRRSWNISSQHTL